MADPFHMLKHEHRVIERALHALDGICARLDCGQQVPPEALLEVVDFLRVYADDFHHGKEETHLFAALCQEGFPLHGGALGKMAEEHEIERKLLTAMLCAIEPHTVTDAASERRFVIAAHRYTQHLTSHMEVEEQSLFKLADEILEESGKAMLARALGQHSGLFGLQSPDAYAHRASELEERWAV